VYGDIREGDGTRGFAVKKLPDEALFPDCQILAESHKKTEEENRIFPPELRSWVWLRKLFRAVEGTNAVSASFSR